jgi:hypothetical protein
LLQQVITQSLRSSLRQSQHTPSPNSPASDTASPVAPVPKRPVFSELARRISMHRSLAGVVLAAKDAAAAAATSTNGTASNAPQSPPRAKGAHYL